MRLSKLFDTLDLDGSGSLVKPELVSWARGITDQAAGDSSSSWSSGLNARVIEQWSDFWTVLKEECDADNDGRIDRQEWVDFWTRQWHKSGA